MSPRMMMAPSTILKEDAVKEIKNKSRMNEKNNMEKIIIVEILIIRFPNRNCNLRLYQLKHFHLFVQCWSGSGYAAVEYLFVL